MKKRFDIYYDRRNKSFTIYNLNAILPILIYTPEMKFCWMYKYEDQELFNFADKLLFISNALYFKEEQYPQAGMSKYSL